MLALFQTAGNSHESKEGLNKLASGYVRMWAAPPAPLMFDSLMAF